MPENELNQPTENLAQEIRNQIHAQAAMEPIIHPPSATVYANHFGLGMTVFDLALVFGEAVGLRQGDGRPIIQQRVKILISPLLAKIISRSLAEGVAEYERQFGEIKEPEAAGAFVER